MARAFVFPGQGSQAVGMGVRLAAADPVAKAVFDEVDEALGERLSTLMAQGPAEELTLTQNAQPALMAVSVAVARALAAQGLEIAGAAKFAAGHSLGEYSALTAAGALSLSDAARALRARGLAMQAAVPVGEGAMAAIIGLELEGVAQAAAKAAAETGLACAAANDNAPGQVVISGAAAAVARAGELAREAGAKRALPLPVSAPFHCALMAPAAARMAEVLAEIEIAAPKLPIVANVTAAPVDDPDEIRRLLVAQVTAPVRWRESVEAMAAAGVTELVELGSGKVLSGLARRIDKRLMARAIETVEDVAEFAASL